MPELPEVHTVASALNKLLIGKAFEKIEIFTEKLRLPLSPLLDSKLLNQPIIDVRRRGRYIVIELSGGIALTVHLGMTGVFREAKVSDERRKHEHVIFHLNDGHQLRFECPRRFSSIVSSVLEHPGGEPPMLKKLGVEPLKPDFTASYLYQQLQKRKCAIKIALMDNQIVVGIGNIYAAEILFKSGISPLRPANRITMKDCAALVKNTRSILNAAIKAGGTTFSDYRQLDGSEGKFVRELLVYGRKGLPCVNCTTPIETISHGGRTSFYCPKCQK